MHKHHSRVSLQLCNQSRPATLSYHYIIHAKSWKDTYVTCSTTAGKCTKVTNTKQYRVWNLESIHTSNHWLYDKPKSWVANTSCTHHQSMTRLQNMQTTKSKPTWALHNKSSFQPTYYISPVTKANTSLLQWSCLTCTNPQHLSLLPPESC